MNQHKEIQYWKKKKTEVGRTVKALALKREKTLYLYEGEKQSRRKTRELQLQTLLGYEAKELQQARADLQAINSRIAGLEKEERKYSGVKIIGVLSLLAILFTFAGLLVYHNEKETPETIVEESAPGILINSLGDKISAFLQEYSSGNNLLTGAVVSTLPVEEQAGLFPVPEPDSDASDSSAELIIEPPVEAEEQEDSSLGIQQISIQNIPTITVVLNTTK